METVVDIVGNEEARDDDIAVRETADPVVYQLVRVDGYGRLVPATEDEVAAVEDLLDDNKLKIRSPDSGQTLECSKNYGSTLSSSNIAQLQGLEGQPQPEVLEVSAGEPSMSPNPPTVVEEVDVQHEEIISSLDSKASGGNVCQSGRPDACSKLSDGSNEIKSSNSTIDSDLRPDFSLLNGEIHLENLSVRDLQETFKATFGRETSVKDKQWLKRRIIMGLTNSCDFSTTTLVIIDDRVVKKVKEDTCQSVASSVLVDCVVTSAVDSEESPTTCHDKQAESHLIDNGMMIQSSAFQDNCGSKDADTEERPAKRVRKPTKRYIEELSEGEPRDSGAKEVSSGNHHGYDQPSAKVSSRPFQNFGLEGRCFTRMDSLGGSGIQVPYVSRIRRSRPRENFMTLMPSGMGISARPEKSDFGSNKQLDNDAKNKTTNSPSPRWIQEPLVAYSEQCNLETEKKTIKLEKEIKPIKLEKEIKLRDMESYKTSSDDEVVTVPTANGGMRRKHHRPWTLGEVVKLVEGVAKYGAGRWSEIKRLAFASYSYRTSVDLKDKWRNLLRASVAEAPTGNGMNSSRKQASVAIPAPILSRVRELADMQTQVQPSFSSSKLAAHND